MKTRIILLTAMFAVLFAAFTPADYAQGTSVRTPFKIRVAVTIPDIVPIVKAVGRDAVDVVGIMLPGSDEHSYTLTPEAITTVQASDLIVFMKSDSLQFEANLLDAAGNIAKLDWPDYQRKGAALKNFPGFDQNPHGFWLAEENSKAIAAAIAEALVIRGADIDIITANLAAFTKELAAINESGTSLITDLGRERSVWVAMIPCVAYVIDNLGLGVGSITLNEESGFASGMGLAEIAINLSEGLYAGIVCPLSMKDGKAGEMARQLSEDTGSPVCYVRYMDTPADGSFLAQLSYNNAAIATAAAIDTHQTQFGGVPVSAHVIWGFVVFILLITIVMLNKRLYWVGR